VSGDWWSTVERLAKSDKASAADADAVEKLLAETGRSLEEFERDLALVRDLLEAESDAKALPREAVFERRERELAEREAALREERAAFEARQRDAKEAIDGDRSVLRTEVANAKAARDRVESARAALEDRKNPRPPLRVLTTAERIPNGRPYGMVVNEALRMLRDLKDLRRDIDGYRKAVATKEQVIEQGGTTIAIKPAIEDRATEQNLTGRIAATERGLDKLIGELREFRAGFDVIEEPEEWRTRLAEAGV
jgi:hypothetical protein